MGMTRKIAIGTVALFLGLTGCGSSHTGNNGDPATVVPAAAPLYVSAVISASPNAVTAARKLTRLRNPYGRFAQALLSDEDFKPQFARDLEPWMGDRVGVFVTSLSAERLAQVGPSAQFLLETALNGRSGAATFGRGGLHGAIVIDTSDEDRARAFLAKWSRSHTTLPHRYRNVDYSISPDSTAAALVKGFVVIGSESGLKGVIDTALGGSPLSAAPGYRRPTRQAIGNLFVSPTALTRALHGQGPGLPQLVTVLDSAFAGAKTVSAVLTATSSSLRLEGEERYDGSPRDPFGEQGAQALARLPGGAWLAAGVGDVGSNAQRATRLLTNLVTFVIAGAFDPVGGGAEIVLKELSSPRSGLGRVFSGWAGSGAFFVSGTGLFNLQAALVIESKDPAASRAAVGKLASVIRKARGEVQRISLAGTDAAATVKIPGLPVALLLADGQGKLVVGVGQASVQGALNASSTLSTSPSYAVAARTLGGGIEPSLIVEVPQILAFLEGLGLAQNPQLARVIPYLKSIGTVTAGSATSGHASRFAAVVGLA
jgi:Protein of unknown function (DUF3352)